MKPEARNSTTIKKGFARRSSPKLAFVKTSASEGGQVMLLTVMMLTGVILSVTSLVALVVLYQLRQTGDVTASSQAIFAADAGIECALYKKVKNGVPSEWGDCTAGKLANGAEFKVTLDGNTIRSAGKSRKSGRAFETTF